MIQFPHKTEESFIQELKPTFQPDPSPSHSHPK